MSLLRVINKQSCAASRSQYGFGFKGFRVLAMRYMNICRPITGSADVRQTVFSGDSESRGTDYWDVVQVLTTQYRRRYLFIFICLSSSRQAAHGMIVANHVGTCGSAVQTY